MSDRTPKQKTPVVQSKPRLNRDHKLLMLSATLLLIAAGIFGSVFLLQWQSARAQPARINIPRLTNAEEDAIIARVKWLRERWEPWARAHKDSITRMLSSAPTDQEALMQLYDQIPDWTQMQQQLNTSPYDLTKPDVSLTWPVNGKRGDSKLAWRDPSARNDPAYQDREHKADAYEIRMRQETFTHFHNIAISRSVNKGVIYVTLWADGRITRDTTAFSSKSTYPEQADGLQELAPRFDFLN